jgi:CRP-like cAMP-binding protein
MAQAAVLANVPLFTELSLDERESLGGHLRPTAYRRGQTIFLTGDPGDGLYVVERGRVKIALTTEQGKEIVLAMVGPSEFFGDLALLDGEPRSADAIAAEPCRLWLLRRANFLRFLDDHPGAARTLLAVLSRRLRRNAQLIQDAAFLAVPGRLARLLVELAERDGSSVPDGVHIGVRLTQSELAGLVGATRESVNKWLRAFERQDLLHYRRGQLIVRDLPALRHQIG